MEEQYDLRWLRNTLRESLAQETGLFVDAAAHGPGTRPLDPRQREYLLRLIAAIREGRSLTSTYNYVLLALLLLFSLRHWSVKYRNVRRSRARDRDERAVETVRPGDQDSVDDEGASSSGSSTVQGNATPPELAKHVDIDVERVPLLRPGRTTSSRRTLLGSFHGWLAYQPPSLPIINRQPPSNGATLFVLCFLALNAFYQFYHMPLQREYAFAFADRAALVFTMNLPLLYLLAAKNQPLEHLTGRSYESLNILHRRVGELLCFMAVVHTAGMLLYQVVFCPDWFRTRTLWEFFTERLVLLGIGAFVSYEALYVTSLGSFRQRCYELFLAAHVVLQIAALAFLWLHFPTARLYVNVSLAIFIVDRIVWRILVKRNVLDAELTVLPDGETVMMSANWQILPRKSKLSFNRGIKAGWKPTDHVFITIPALGRAHALQAHPFTIASAAPAKTADGTHTHAWFNLLIRSHSGFTRDLLQHAHQNRSVAVRVDGPYGSPRALDAMTAADDVVLVAGGSGIAVVFPVAWSLVMERRARRRVHLLWIVHAEDHRHWVPSGVLDELVARGLDLVVPAATSVAGRPDVAAMLEDWIAEGHMGGRETGVMVSGPDGLNRLVRNTAAGKMAEGARVHVEVEKFGW